ncbi:TolC family protein [Sphingobacterium deserti]|uniref:Outer membrane efflux protein n=1 Tax=Sphingobacterium deserti TaxID=1229276 RepID=A0A0B8T076_9SPHI|nr:TolC family protein [Sphingobacterium deserti]KGE13571.1 outer membrane efflux protein [Sphingobacterium deserti]
MRTLFIYVVAVAISVFGARAQSGALDGYLNEGLDNNLVLQEKNLSLQRALNAMQVAKSLYLPAIDVDVAYSHAKGGRSIELPVGDLLNPVYNTLNALTQSQAFPQIGNETINFLPQNYYDAKIRTTMPLLNTDIGYNERIKAATVHLQENEVEIYKRELIKEIKNAYYKYLTAVQIKAVYTSSLNLALEGRRVNQKLLDAGKGLPAYVIRANSEVAAVEAQLADADKNIKNAALYFNMLLNRDAGSAILEDDLLARESLWSLAEWDDVDVSNREELKSLETGIAIQESIVKMNKQYLVPKISGFFDLGSQAEGLKFNDNSRYFMVGLTMKMPIFQGNRNRLKIQEAKVDLAVSKNKKAQAEQQLSMAIQMARNEVLSSFKNFEKAKVQLETASTYQRLIQKGFSAGVNTYMETIDARSQYTTAKLSETVSKLQILMALASLERESATFQIVQ